jgi:hemoglobin
MTVLILAIGTATRADDTPLDRAELDRRVVFAVYDAAVKGTELWNKSQNYEGCFRLYQGTLAAVIPLLDHRPKLAAAAKAKLDKAASMTAVEGAFLLREALDDIQYDIAPGPKPKIEPKKITLWDRLGGEKGVNKIVEDLFNQAIEKPEVNLLRDKKVKLDAKGVAHLKQQLVDFISAATGGPFPYKGKDLKSAHAGMKITEKEFDALVKVFAEVLEKNKVAKADSDALLKAVNATKKEIVEGKGN